MHVSFTSHSIDSGFSSQGVFNYLSKENETLEDKSLLFNNEHFFSNDFDLENNNSSNHIIDDCINEIDSNVSSFHKTKDASFYILNVAPSQKELHHIEIKAISILEDRGVYYNENSDDESKKYYLEQKNIITDILLKDYTNDLMEVYADNMNREIYSDLNNLPNKNQTDVLNKKTSILFNEHLKELKLDDESLGLVEKVENVEISDFKEIGKNNFELNYKNELHSVFISSDKYKLQDNKIILDKNYLEQTITNNSIKQKLNNDLAKFKIEYKNEWENAKQNNSSLGKVNYDLANKDFKNILTKNKSAEFYTKIDAKILKDKEDKIFIQIKDNNDKELKLWVNKSDLHKPKESYEIKSDVKLNIETSELKILKDVGTKRNEKDLELKPLDFGKQLKLDEKESNLIKVELKVNNSNDKVVLTFNKKVVENIEGKYYVPNHILQKAKENSLRAYVNMKYSNVKENIKNDVWKANGFNPEKRKLAKDDLKYFAKIENQRTYKVTNKFDYKLIKENKETLEKIDVLLKESKGQITSPIKDLQNKLHLDKHTKEVVAEGMIKGGNNKHIHIVVSRYDATLPKHLKMSLSPVSNQKDAQMPNGKQVGFNRDNYFKKAEKLFDNKFDYSRQYENTYQFKNEVYKLKSTGKSLTQPVIKELFKEIKKEVKNPITQLKQEINPIAKLKQELKFVPLPSNFSMPKSKIDLLLKMGKLLIQTADKGMKM